MIKTNREEKNDRTSHFHKTGKDWRMFSELTGAAYPAPGFADLLADLNDEHDSIEEDLPESETEDDDADIDAFGDDEEMQTGKAWSLPLEIKKADPDHRVLSM